MTPPGSASGAGIEAAALASIGFTGGITGRCMAAWCQPGIGQALATALVERGDTVVHADVNADGAKQVAAGLGSRASAVGLDVRDADAVTQLVDVVGEIVAAVRSGHAGAAHRRGDLHQPGPGPRRDPQLRRRRVRRALPALPGRPPGDLQRRPTRREHQDRPGAAHRPRAAGFDAGAGRSWPSTWSPWGWSPRGWSTIISHQGLRLLLGQEGGSVQRVQGAEDLDRPGRRDQEEPGARAVCDRRRPSGGPVPVTVTPRSWSAWTSSGR